jgi:hypothetical protein
MAWPQQLRNFIGFLKAAAVARSQLSDISHGFLQAWKNTEMCNKFWSEIREGRNHSEGLLMDIKADIEIKI